MVWLPTVRDDTVKVASPEPFSEAVPRLVAPSRNVTVPVGVLPPPKGFVTVGAEGYRLAGNGWIGRGADCGGRTKLSMAELDRRAALDAQVFGDECTVKGRSGAVGNRSVRDEEGSALQSAPWTVTVVPEFGKL